MIRNILGKNLKKAVPFKLVKKLFHTIQLKRCFFGAVSKMPRVDMDAEFPGTTKPNEEFKSF